MTDLKEYVYHEVLNEEILGLAYEIHRSMVKGTFFLDEDDCDESNYKLVIENGFDVFGQPLSGVKKTVECKCPSCHRNLAAVRFAPHLEKCMGMGRNSSRIASQRIANSGKSSAVESGCGVGGLGDGVEAGDLMGGDDVNDGDWYHNHREGNPPATSRKSKKRKGNNSSSHSPRAAKTAASAIGPGGKLKSRSSKSPSQRHHHAAADHNAATTSSYASWNQNSSTTTAAAATTGGEHQQVRTTAAAATQPSAVRRSKKSSSKTTSSSSSKKGKKKHLQQQAFNAT